MTRAAIARSCPLPIFAPSTCRFGIGLAIATAIADGGGWMMCCR